MKTRANSRRKQEPTIALINIVFLMLIFFLVAGTLAPPLDDELTLVDTTDQTTTPPPNALVIGPEGALTFRGETLADVSVAVTALQSESVTSTATDTSEPEGLTIRVVPDRALSANTLVSVGRQLRDAGATRVMIVTQKGMQ